MMQQQTGVSTATLVLTRSVVDNIQQPLLFTTNKTKFIRRHSEKIKENNSNIKNNLKGTLNNRKTLLPLVLSTNQTDNINNSILFLNNTASQSLFNLTKYESNLDQIDQIKLIVKDIEGLKMPTFLINIKNDKQTDQIEVDCNDNLSTITKQPLFKFKKNKCKKQIKKPKLNSNGDSSSVISSNSSSLAPKIATPTASIKSSSSSFDSSSILFSSSSSPSNSSSPSAISSQSQPFFNTPEKSNTHHHKNCHVQRNRNIKCYNYDLDDPDSISIPGSLVNSNDIEYDENEDDEETTPCLNQRTKIKKLLRDYVNEKENDKNCLINNEKAKIVEEEELDDSDTNNYITLHRSTPNLMEIQNEESHLLIQHKSNETVDLLRDSTSMSNLELKTKTKLFNNSKHLNTASTDHNSKLGCPNTIYNNFNTLIIKNNVNNIFSNLIVNKKFTQRFKLLTEGDLHVCKLQHSRNVLSKLLNSKLLRRWKAHRIILTDTEIFSTTKTDYMDSSIPYHTITEISPISKWEPGQKYCLRIATIECHYLLQTNNIYVRDQWIHSILWKKHKFKSERVLRNAIRPEVLIREIKNMIDMSTTTPIDDTEISQHPLELVSEILQKHKLPKQTHEEVIVALSPLLEKNHPSPEICDFFSRHCRDSPRSHIVIEMFSPVVQRILKHNGDFGRYPRMRLFVQDYLMALVSQNAGLQTVQNFVVSMHSTSSQCPFPRVLPNFVSVCLASIHGCFETHRHKSSQPFIHLSPQEQEDQLVCHTTMMYTMSTFEDWRTNLAQLLQSVPFPDQALTHDKFIKIFKNVVKHFAQDPRCEVHQTLLGIREGKEGWFEIFCPGGISCDDDGELFAIMLQTLIGCCCKKKRFLLSINKLLSHIMVLAIREVPCAIETLCAMLDLDGVENVDNKLKIISTLQSTELGLKHYAKVCERQMQLKELQQKGGPRKLTLPSRSTDEDLAKLLLSGSFGNLECLSLAFTNVTSACAEYLIKLPSLRYLNLWSTKFGDQGLELISEHLQRLQVLNLCETPVTDKGLACLASMKQLRKLNLNSTNLSALTFEGLKECLPALQECDIRYTDAW